MTAAQETEAPLRTVRGQRWPDLHPPDLGQWTPELSVTVVLPARDCQDQLDLTLATLSAQSYPAHLLDVVVVDDGSDVSLTVAGGAEDDAKGSPREARVLRLEDAPEHGSGRARDAGARTASGDILLFLDADMLADHRHVESHARWHHVCDHALVLGHKTFVDVSGVTAAEVYEAAGSAGGLDQLLRGRRADRHDWQEDMITDLDDLTRDDEDAFLTVVGATVSIRRDFYVSTGGFAGFGLRGITDTEFGYRAHTKGAVIVPDTGARSVHQGKRSFARKGARIKRARSGLAANHLPIPLFRQAQQGRSWVVPRVEVHLDLTGPHAEDFDVAAAALVTIDAVLASTVTDLRITVITGCDEPDGEASRVAPSWLRDYVQAEARVRFVQAVDGSGFPSPFTLVLEPGLLVAPHTVATALDLLGDAGVLRTLPRTVLGAPDRVGPELWRTRAWERCATQPDPDAAAESLFGARWAEGGPLGVQAAVISTTKQGMIVVR